MRRLISVATLLAVLSTLALAQAQKPAAAAPAASAGASFKKEFLVRYDELFKKVIALASAMPEDKYDWRPAKDVRSIGEVYLHIANANYLFAGAFGGKPPAYLDPKTFEDSKPGKAKTVEYLKEANTTVRALIEAQTDADLEKTVKFFGKDFTVRGVIDFMGMHASEHLGQSIAYARMNGVVPPWSVPQPKPAAKKD